MNKLFGYILGTLALVGVTASSGNAYAATCTTNSCVGTVELLYPAPADDQVYVDLSGAISGLNCAPVAGKYFVMALNTDVKRATWQLLVAAMLSGKSVDVKLNSSTSQCIIQYITVGP